MPINSGILDPRERHLYIYSIYSLYSVSKTKNVTGLPEAFLLLLCLAVLLLLLMAVACGKL